MIVRIFLFLLIPSLSFAQSLTGKWAGKITQDDGGYSYEYGISLELTQSGNLVTGVSRVWLLERPKIYATMKLTGEIRNGRLTYKETAITHEEDLGTYYWCFKAARLDLFTDPRQLRLEGPWWGTDPTPTCPPGKIYLSMALPPPPDNPVVINNPNHNNNNNNNQNQVVNPPLGNDSSSTQIDINPPPDDVVDNPPDDIVVQLPDENDNGNVNGRNVVVQGSAVFKQKEITLYIWDTDEVDGDRVTLIFNGEKVLSDQKISKERVPVKVVLNPGQENLLMLYAENLGKTPPNTAAISWWEGGVLKTKVLHSDMSKCGTLSFKSE